jgi:hypothetical protein
MASVGMSYDRSCRQLGQYYSQPRYLSIGEKGIRLFVRPFIRPSVYSVKQEAWQSEAFG